MSSTFETHMSASRPYLTRKELSRAYKNTISDYRTYTQRKLIIFRFLSDLCVHFSLPRKTLETAVYYFQRYYVFNRFETELCHTVATSCLLLSCKQVETFKKINEICSVSLRLLNVPNIKTETIDNLKKRVFQVELKILEACCFDYRINNHVHIDEYIVKFGKELNLSYNSCYIAWIIAYDVLKLETLLKVPQHCIAVATLKVASELLKSNESFFQNFDHEKFKTMPASINEAYYDILNYYINSFDSCDLKNNVPVEIVASVTLEDFMKLKSASGHETGLVEHPDPVIEGDKYVTESRNSTARERRFVLLQKLVEDEDTILNNKKRKLNGQIEPTTKS